MRRGGFTLIELLIVIAIIVLLVALLGPGFRAVYQLLDITQCASNLHAFHQAITVTQQERPKDYPMPSALEWPDGPMAALETVTAARCPADDRSESLTSYGSNDPQDLLYQSGMGGHFVAFTPGFSCVSRRGVDSNGRTYTEYACEENPTYKATWSGSPWGFSENDGLWRIYDARNGHRELTLVSYTCGFTTNNLWYKGKMIWTDLSKHIGDTFLLSATFTSYGLNQNVCQEPRVSPATVLLLDFQNYLADPTATDFQAQLDDPKSCRHQGQMNVLFVDGSVQLMGPASLYPLLYPVRWRP